MSIQFSEDNSTPITSSARLQEDRAEPSLRPKTILEYIGQEKAKENLQVFIDAAKLRNEPLDHVLLHGPPGLGKTTLAGIIANEMHVNMRITSGPAIEKPGDLVALLTNLSEGDILFVDEIHRLNRAYEEILYPAMEDFAIDIILGKGPSASSIHLDLPHFTLIGATTRSGQLTAPLRDRFGVTIRLELYTPDELKQIVERSADLLNVKIDSYGSYEIASRSRGTPRIANRYLRRVRDFAQVRAVNHVVLPQLEAVVTDLIKQFVAPVVRVVGEVRGIFARHVQEPRRVADVDRNCKTLLAVHVDPVVPFLNRERAVRREGNMVRGRHAEEQPVCARQRERRHLALPLVRLVAELDGERIYVGPHVPRYVCRDVRYLRHAKVIQILRADRRRKRGGINRDHEGAAHVVVVWCHRLELDDMRPDVRVRRRDRAGPVVRTNAVHVRDRLIVAEPFHCCVEVSYVEILASINGPGVGDGDGELRVGDGITRTREDELVVILESARRHPMQASPER